MITCSLLLTLYTLLLPFLIFLTAYYILMRNKYRILWLCLSNWLIIYRNHRKKGALWSEPSTCQYNAHLSVVYFDKTCTLLHNLEIPPPRILINLRIDISYWQTELTGPINVKPHQFQRHWTGKLFLVQTSASLNQAFTIFLALMSNGCFIPQKTKVPCSVFHSVVIT